eukprot:TRINITY_DN71120_c0_g1_i1.p1 TRINITY_DN71120_c0_g1~~TRINITY_DN71120_c0_g1_i1.p1  ORF type:complete len:308 (+),score=79.54 TRINITY_DN71120_c0_g1_i1:69-926(+)
MRAWRRRADEGADATAPALPRGDLRPLRPRTAEDASALVRRCGELRFVMLQQEEERDRLRRALHTRCENLRYYPWRPLPARAHSAPAVRSADSAVPRGAAATSVAWERPIPGASVAPLRRRLCFAEPPQRPRPAPAPCRLPPTGAAEPNGLTDSEPASPDSPDGPASQQPAVPALPAHRPGLFREDAAAYCAEQLRDEREGRTASVAGQLRRQVQRELAAVRCEDQLAAAEETSLLLASQRHSPPAAVPRLPGRGDGIASATESVRALLREARLELRVLERMSPQ